MEEKVKFPKVIVVILHNDLLDALELKDQELAVTLLGTWLEWLVQDFASIISKRKDELPTKVKKDQEPMVYWLALPQSKYFEFGTRALHTKANNVLESVLKVKACNNVRMIKIKDGWNHESPDLIHVNGTKLSWDGEMALWRAMDASVSFNLKE